MQHRCSRRSNSRLATAAVLAKQPDLPRIDLARIRPEPDPVKLVIAHNAIVGQRLDKK